MRAMTIFFAQVGDRQDVQDDQSRPAASLVMRTPDVGSRPSVDDGKGYVAVKDGVVRLVDRFLPPSPRKSSWYDRSRR